MPGQQWAFISDNEAFSRARFRGSTWSKLASNLGGYDYSRRKSLVDSWCYLNLSRDPVASNSYSETDERPFLAVLRRAPRSTGILVQTTYIYRASQEIDIRIQQKVGCRDYPGIPPADNRWDSVSLPAGDAGTEPRGSDLQTWQLSALSSSILPTSQQEDGDGALRPVNWLPFDYADPAAQEVNFGNQADVSWRLFQPEPMVIATSGPSNVLDDGTERSGLGRNIQIRIMKSYFHAGASSNVCQAYLTGVKVHGLIDKEEG